MAVVSKVNVGTPITAAWANSLVTEANNQPVQSGSFYDASGKVGKGYHLSSHGAWHISCTNHGTVCLNAGQIYINNLLVTPAKSEDGSWNGSYNQKCSCGNFSDFEVTQCTKDTLPVFYIIIKMPVDVTSETIKKVTATLYKSMGEQPTPPEPPALEEDETYKIIQLNEVHNCQIKQLISGTIYLNFNSSTGGYDIQQISLVAGDGINIDYDKNVYSIAAKVSLIEGDGIIANQYTDASGTIIMEVSANVPDIKDRKPISLIEGDGIIITPAEYPDVITYTISVSPSIINIDFDEEWFIIEEDGTVTINEEKLAVEATELAKSVSSEIQSTASLKLDNWTDTSNNTNGAIHTTIETTSGESATATVRSVRY